MSENVSLNRTKKILNRKNAIIHNKSRNLFLTERQDKQMIIEASRFRVARSLTASPLTRRYSTSWNENKNLLHLQANHQEIFLKANELIHDMLFKTLRIAWRIYLWVVYTRIRQHVWDNFLEIFSCARIRRKGKRYAEPDKIILNRTKTIIHNTILPNDEINNWLEWKEGSQSISSRPVVASRFSNFKRCQIDNYMHVNFWLKRLLCRFRKTEQKETSSGGKMNNKSSG